MKRINIDFSYLKYIKNSYIWSWEFVQQGTISHLSDKEVMINSDVKAFQVNLEDLKAKLMVVYQS